MTQKERILKYIRDFGSITSLEAFQQLGCTQLGARIFELKRLGYDFKTERVVSKNRYGEDVYFTKYSFKEN